MGPTVLETAANAVQARTRIGPHIYQTPLLPAKTTGKAQGATVLFKTENFQLTGSFKVRGATAKISAHPADGTPLIAASTGNFGIGCALAASKLGRRLTVVVPENVQPAKLAKIRAYGGVDVIMHGAECGASERHARGLAASGEYVYVSPYNDPDVAAGQGTTGLEILEQCPQVDNIFISMGGGGLISGIGSVVKAFNPRTKIYGVSTANTQALAASMAAGRVVETEHLETLADAVAGGMDEDSITLPLAMEVVDEVLVCKEEEIATALRSLALEEGMMVEGSAALALAGFNCVVQKLVGQTSVILLCGGNFDQDVIMRTVIQTSASGGGP
ncbi:uncharacterized protein E0L32_006201 [Thyridium curvatum]|uniref:Tryptophan synthase beta chain-like PALP domain-containing protein n=1 Tax=Thyridium curvatum TaxID=1093900 RepID=A0A507B8T2_9PEZI|nr:uncharacterized protein E0L32_006201 [Thyridium curvatum]TPX13471.1 hypothetical protein E0L32_006201 [Thyridium curvatum]